MVSKSRLIAAAFGIALAACSNWNRATPVAIDNSAIETEIRKNLAGDDIFGTWVDCKDGVVTIRGSFPSAELQRVRDDVAKVPGVRQVIIINTETLPAKKLPVPQRWGPPLP